MARVSDASRAAPERGGTAPSPLGREGGLSRLMRSARGGRGLSVAFVRSNSKSAGAGRRGASTSGVSKSYVPDGAVRRSLEAGASRLAKDEAGGGASTGEPTSAMRGADSSASRVLRSLCTTEGELPAGGAISPLAVAALLSTAWSVDLLVSRAAALESGSRRVVAVGARLEAVWAGVSASEATGCVGSLVTGRAGAGFLGSKVGEAVAEDVARGETGGLPLEFRAASLGECRRFGGIGVTDF